MKIADAVAYTNRHMGNNTQNFGTEVLVSYLDHDGVKQKSVMIDPEIADAIQILNNKGIHTAQSCQGEDFIGEPGFWKHHVAAYVVFRFVTDAQLEYIFKTFTERGFETDWFETGEYRFPVVSSEPNQNIFVGDQALNNTRFCETLLDVANEIAPVPDEYFSDILRELKKAP